MQHTIQNQRQAKIDAVDVLIHTAIEQLEEQYPQVRGLVTALASTDANLLALGREQERVDLLRVKQQQLTRRHLSSIEKLAVEQQYGDDPPKVGCFDSRADGLSVLTCWGCGVVWCGVVTCGVVSCG